MSCPTGLLISIDDENHQKTVDQDLVPENAAAQEKPIKPEPHVQNKTPPVRPKPPSVKTLSPPTSPTSPKIKEPTLCGYLARVSTAGLMKLAKTRWFSYNPDCCELIYSRNPTTDGGSSSQLGKISLRRASFNFSAESMNDNMFSISADGTTHNLQAPDRKTLLWWIQELQLRRRTFNSLDSELLANKPDWHGTMLGSSVFWVPNSSNEQGLIKMEAPGTRQAFSDTATGLRIFPLGEEPPDTVGDQAALSERPRSASILSGNGLGTLSRLAKPNLENINSAFTHAGEAAKKKLRDQANKLKQNSAFKVEDSNSTAAKMLTGYDGKDMGYSSFIQGLKGEIVDMNEELGLLKMKLQTKEESIQVLKMELDRYETLDKNTSSHIALSAEERKLRSEVISLKLTNERLQQEREESEKREAALEEQNAMLREMLSIKDQVVMQLGNKVHALESSLEDLTDSHVKLKEEKNEEFVVIETAPPSDDDTVSRLKDRAEGFMMQNKLLNNEILELANLRQIDAVKLQSIQDKERMREAQYCQLNSKYLVLLAEMNKPRSGSVGLAVSGDQLESSDQDRKDMMKILIQEALADTAGDCPGTAPRKESKYDQYGFSCLPEDDTESSLLASASHMEKRASDILDSRNNYQASVCAKWQNYMANNKELLRGDDLKLLIRYGVPHEFRPKVWTWMVKNRTQQIRRGIDPDNALYRQLTQQKVAPLASKQIELDLLRTLPNNRHFSSLSSTGIEQLRRVLRAYSIHNPSIGYCQGLNRIAAVALLYLSEEEAFWCLVAVIEVIMPQEYYSNTLTASQADQRVFRELMAEKLPRLHKHLEVLQVDCSLITFNWLLCIFCDNVPPDTMLHIWDVFLNEGSKVLFRYGLAFFRSVEEEILQLNDYMSVFAFLRVMSHRMHDIRALTQIAFQGMNPFPMRRIHRLRALHMEKVDAELRELDILRRGFVSYRRDPLPERDSDDD